MTEEFASHHGISKFGGAYGQTGTSVEELCGMFQQLLNRSDQPNIASTATTPAVPPEQNSSTSTTPSMRPPVSIALPEKTLAAGGGWSEVTLLTVYKSGLRKDLQAEMVCRVTPASTSEAQPMELDRTRLPETERCRRLRENLCLYCGRTGHRIANSSQRPGSSRTLEHGCRRSHTSAKRTQTRRLGPVCQFDSALRGFRHQQQQHRKHGQLLQKSVSEECAEDPTWRGLGLGDKRKDEISHQVINERSGSRLGEDMQQDCHSQTRTSFPERASDPHLSFLAFYRPTGI
ncbi:hypothetical protein AOLI_G00067500 [Acnodon oligacanthus]